MFKRYAIINTRDFRKQYLLHDASRPWGLFSVDDEKGVVYSCYGRYTTEASARRAKQDREVQDTKY